MIRFRCTALAGVMAAALCAFAPANVNAANLYRDGRELLAILRVNGEKHTNVLFAAVAGRNAALTEAIERAGGTVDYRDDSVDYIRARLPLDALDVLASNALVHTLCIDMDSAGRLPVSMKKPPGIDRRGMEQIRPHEQQMEAARSEQRAKYPPQALGDYPVSQPYPVIRDLGGVDLLRKHPTFDGRGVTIALLDGAPDFLLPELQEAKTLDGQVIPKVVSVLTSVDPVVDGGPQWVDMRQEVSAANGTVSYRGKSYRVASSGRYRIGLFNERLFAREVEPLAGLIAQIDGDVNRDGNPAGNDGLFAVLWDEKRGVVWVDTDQDGDFTNEQALRESAPTADIGVFGRDNPATAVRDSVGFAIQVDRARKFVALNLGAGGHGAVVVGAMLASRGSNGRFDGIAPGAQLVSLNPWPSGTHAVLEGLIRVVRDPKVDLAVLESDNATDRYLLRDGRSLAGEIISRLLSRYGKPILVPGDNQSAFSHNVEYGLGRDALTIGGYQSRDSYAFYAGITPLYQDNLHAGGMSHGPAGNGRLKPDVLSPSGQLDLNLGFAVDPLMGSTRAGLFALPPGYAVSGGTSQATPTAAGALAVLISAAKQTGIPYDLKRLLHAFRMGARFIDHHQAHEQGNGVIDLAASWRILQQLKDVELVEIDSRVQVNTAVGRFMVEPSIGVGIFEREGWSAGQSGERIVTFTRRSGPAAPMTFSVSWKGNDGTFAAQSEISLPLNQPVDLAVRIAPQTSGAHSALLVLSNSQAPVAQHRIMATVVAASQFTPANQYTVREDVDVRRPGDGGIFVNVPPGVSALRIVANSPGRLNLRAHGPDSADDAYLVAFPAKPGEKALVVERPRPGVWSIELENAQDIVQFISNVAVHPLAPVPLPLTRASITASIYGAEFEPLGTSESISVRNTFAPIEARVVSSALGSGLSRSLILRNDEQRLQEIEVPDGTDDLIVRLDRDANSDAVIDLYLFDCSGKSCELRARDVGNRHEKILRIGKPAAGRWVALVDGFRVPKEGVSCDYLDVHTSSKYGALSSSDVRTHRAPGESWTAPAHIWQAEQPLAPRKPYASLMLESSGFGDEGPRFVGWQGAALDAQSDVPHSLTSSRRVRESGGNERSR